jgi:septal ring factor EnvC (AmiA/AmiB activator)
MSNCSQPPPKPVMPGMRIAVCFLLLLLALFCASCQKEGPVFGETAEKNVREKTAEALETVKDLADNRDRYREKVEKELSEQERKIDELIRKASEAKEQLGDQFSDLKEKRDSVREKLEELKSSSDLAWEDIKEGLDGAMKELGEAYEKAKSRF